MGPFEAFKLYRIANRLQDAWNKSFWRTSQMGWKTITGAAIIAVSGALKYLESQGLCQGCDAISEGLFALGNALGLIGLRHAAAKGGQ